MSTTSTNITLRADAPSPTVLVVEDEVLIRLVIADYLRDCGYKVHEAVSGEEAIAILQAPEVSIDVVFSDVEMPGSMDGFALARWVRANKPGMEIILTSGIERSADIAATLCEAGPLMKKPYSSQDVVDRLRQLAAKARRS
ncbi:histidine kinase [Microvirga ossetica]|uniref:Histidine kinase n=1 Tax=Microvirga ossetica TaxID=1882682 RepID=A0A1B2EHL7_9HYPH|nr:response regulator [Microvirga ossetica]ANY79468.1 histidine kinase [Microvirga ossetica]